MEIYAVNINHTLPPAKYDTLLNTLPSIRQAKIRKFFREEDAIRTLVGDVLIRTLIKRTIPIKSAVISFQFNEYGKPFLEDFPYFQFNVSHSGNWVVCAFDEYPIGIDVEQMKDIKLDIAERFFTRQELEYLLSKQESERLNCFYSFWTLKESYIKAIGKGLSIPLDSFSISIDDEKGVIGLEKAYDDTSYFFRQYYLDEQHFCSVCATHSSFPEKLNIVSLEEL